MAFDEPRVAGKRGAWRSRFRCDARDAAADSAMRRSAQQRVARQRAAKRRAVK
ncbi:hypothetical protein BPC006_II2886 [Burkholderia pseudomallei BPC006]|nr:hypothetical protein BPC006_II2886 [Burkholderia pseudomallei BPC006]EDO90513.1 hypothetical protein BURPSPAST_H0372 [Burkholderia pseudomallei Pasteur 52237]